MEILTGRIIYPGKASGRVLRSDSSIGFFGHVDSDTGEIKEPGHPLFGESIANKILVFPYAKGSTVGSYTLYSLKKKGKAPAALIISQCELIIAVGAIIAEIPAIDQVDINRFNTNDLVTIEREKIIVQRTPIY